MSSAVAVAVAVAFAFVLPLALLIKSMRQRSHVVLLSPTYPCSIYPFYTSSPPAQTLFGFKQEDLNANVMLAQRPGPPSCTESTHTYIHPYMHTSAYNSLRKREKERERGRGKRDLAQVEGIKGKAS